MVYRTSPSVRERSHLATTNTESTDHARWSNMAPGPNVLEVDGLAPEHLEFAHLDISDDCKEVLANARAPSTVKTYSLKWKRFCNWCRTVNLHPLYATSAQILPFFLHLARLGLSHSTLKVFLAAISRFRQDGSSSLYSTRITKQFFKGLFRLFPPVRRPPPAWHLNVVLTQLMRHPFEPIHRADMKFVTWKVALLLALTSARHVERHSRFYYRSAFPPVYINFSGASH